MWAFKVETWSSNVCAPRNPGWGCEHAHNRVSPPGVFVCVSCQHSGAVWMQAVPGPTCENPSVAMDWTEEPWTGCSERRFFGLLWGRGRLTVCMRFQINQKMGSWLPPHRVPSAVCVNIQSPQHSLWPIPAQKYLLFQCADPLGRVSAATLWESFAQEYRLGLFTVMLFVARYGFPPRSPQLWLGGSALSQQLWGSGLQGSCTAGPSRLCSVWTCMDTSHCPGKEESQCWVARGKRELSPLGSGS